MKKDESPAKTRLKKTYGKPTISEVKLRPEEAVLGFCKNDASGGPIQAICTAATCCVSEGS